MREDYATVDHTLDGSTTGTMIVETVDRVRGAGINRKRENCTERCNRMLVQMAFHSFYLPTKRQVRWHVLDSYVTSEQTAMV
jgi:hypothetical protein